MKRLSFSLGLSLAALTLLANATTAHAGERPIQARATGGLSFSGSSPRLVGKGLAIHLGKSVVVVTLDEYEFAEGNLVPRTLAIYGAHDALFASVDAALDPETGIIAGTITFTGGSGRFAHATGSARLLIVLDDAAGLYDLKFDFAIDGTIDY